MLSDYKELDSLIGDYLEMRRAYKIRTSYIFLDGIRFPRE